MFELGISSNELGTSEEGGLVERDLTEQLGSLGREERPITLTSFPRDALFRDDFAQTQKFSVCLADLLLAPDFEDS